MNVTDEKIKEPLERVGLNLLRIKSALTTHAISYNSSAFKPILSYIPEGLDLIHWQARNESYDAFFMRHFLSQNKAFCTNEYLATQRDSFSDINLGNATHGKPIMENFYKMRPA